MSGKQAALCLTLESMLEEFGVVNEDTRRFVSRSLQTHALKKEAHQLADGISGIQVAMKSGGGEAATAAAKKSWTGNMLFFFFK